MKTFSLAIGLFIVSHAHGQTLRELLKQAESNYPLLKAKAFEVTAGQSNVSLAKNTALPAVDAAYQVNYATYNNITGMAATQFIVPMTGPPSSGNAYSGVYGSAAGLLLNWEPFTFGQRSARIDIAKSNLQYNQADAKQEVFNHQVNVISTYLDVLMAHELVKVFSKNVDRSNENIRAVRTLTVSGLRPGVDTALFNAELSRAKIDLLNQARFLETQQAGLAELLAGETLTYPNDSAYFHSLPLYPADTSSSIHPLIKLSNSKLELNWSQRTSIQRSLYPKLTAWGTAYARGSGVHYDGSVNSRDGLSLSRYNYGVGLQLSVPLLRVVDVRSQLHLQDALISAQNERLNQVKLELHKQRIVADLTLRNSFEIAKESRVFYQSAEFAFRALFTRYNSGLANYADLMQVQYSLVKAETDLRKSYLECWKALLYDAAVQGDLNVFLNQVK
jgi:outer membrane protein